MLGVDVEEFLLGKLYELRYSFMAFLSGSDLFESCLEGGYGIDWDGASGIGREGSGRILLLCWLAL